MKEDSVLLRTQAASDFTYPKPQSQVIFSIFAVRKYLLQYSGQNNIYIYYIKYIYIYTYIYIYIYIYMYVLY